MSDTSTDHSPKGDKKREAKDAREKAPRVQAHSGWPQTDPKAKSGEEELPTFFDRGDPAPVPFHDEFGDGDEITPQLSPGAGGALGGTVNLQPTYKSYMGVALPGTPATMTNWDAESYIVDKAATAAIPFGVAVSVKGVSLTDGSQRSIIVGGTAAACAGVTYRDITQMPSYIAEGNGYPAGWNAGVMSRGDIWVQVGSAIAVTDAVKFVTATGVFSGAGTITLANCRWMRGAAQAGDLALLRVNFPAPV